MFLQQIMMIIDCFLNIGDGDAEESFGRVVHQAAKREEQGAGDEEHWEQVNRLFLGRKKAFKDPFCMFTTPTPPPLFRTHSYNKN